MNKFLTLFLSIVLVSNVAFAQDYACPNTYVLNPRVSRFISKSSGSNFIHTKILEHVLERQAKREFDGDFDVEIKSFGGKDLKEGKFKSLNATGENIKIDNFLIDKVSINSLCEFNQFKKNNDGKYEFITDFPADITFMFSSENLNKIIEMPEFQNRLAKINSQLNGFMNIKDIKFDIKNDKLIYDINYTLPFAPNEQKISVSSDMMFFNNTVYNQSESSNNKSVILNFLKMTNALNYINPLDFSTKFLQNNNIATTLKNVYVKNDKVIVEALLIITR